MWFLNYQYQLNQICITHFVIHILYCNISKVSLPGMDLVKLYNYNPISYLAQCKFTSNCFKEIYKCFPIYLFFISIMQYFLITIHMLLTKCNLYDKIITLCFVGLCKYYTSVVCVYYILPIREYYSKTMPNNIKRCFKTIYICKDNRSYLPKFESVPPIQDKTKIFCFVLQTSPQYTNMVNLSNNSGVFLPFKYYVYLFFNMLSLLITNSNFYQYCRTFENIFLICVDKYSKTLYPSMNSIYNGNYIGLISLIIYMTVIILISATSSHNGYTDENCFLNGIYSVFIIAIPKISSQAMCKIHFFLLCNHIPIIPNSLFTIC